jgi:hypothetical protein
MGAPPGRPNRDHKGLATRLRSSVSPFAQLAKPMTAVLADLRVLAGPLSAFAAF